MTEKGTYIPVINTLRGLASLAVCVFHFVYSPKGLVENEAIRDVFYFGHKGVEIFFVISSIVIPLSLLKIKYTSRNFWLFLKKRFVRVEPPYLMAVLIGITYLIIRNYIPGTKEVDLTPSITDILLHIGYMVPFFEEARWVNNVFWTLAVEFQFYVVIALAFYLLNGDKLLRRVLFYAIFILPPLFYPESDLFISWSGYFSFGIIYVLYRFGKIKFSEFIIVELIAVISYTVYGSWLSLALAIVAISVIHVFPMVRARITDWLGDISYSLYLLHNIIGAAFLNFTLRWADSQWQVALIIILSIAVSLFSAYLMWRFIEKPTQILSKKITWNSKPSSAIWKLG